MRRALFTLVQIFMLAIACCSDLLEAIDIPGSEIIAIVLANFLLSSLQVKIYYFDLICFFAACVP